jgi:predicted nucleotidyltransferase
MTSMTTYTIPYQGDLNWIHTHTIFLTRHGSHAYGLNTPTSDLDVKGVAIPPAEYLLGYLKHFEQLEVHEPDLVIYEMRKFFRLAADCNPNIIEVLWTDPADHLMVSPLGEALLTHRAAFLSQKARHTFSGYAISQLKRIKGHYRWLKNPPKAPPTRAECGLPERTVIPTDQLLAAEARIKEQLDAWSLNDLEDVDPAVRINLQNQMSRMLAEIQISTDEQWRAAARTVGYDENFIELMDRERKYRGQQNDWQQFQNWKKHRNPARAALEAQHGYDAKHAMHLVRLLKMCKEILETGQVQVRRPDREELLAIRNGAWSYEQLLEWAETQDRALDEVRKRSVLPHSPDRTALDALCVRLIEQALSERRT